jgi:LuxR family transcriptional regulator, maltose regulon positive regulatory protein
VSVVAPPGYGKTVLLADWASRAGEPVAWLTLDALDNDPSVFLAYLAASIDRIEPIDDAVAAAIASPPSRVLASAVPHLAHALYAIGRPATVVLDDAQRLEDRTCLDALTQLLDYLPPGLRVAVASRAEPDLPLGRIRARGDLLEVAGGDLALDAEEAQAIAGAAGWSLAPSEAQALVERTEGWAAGVYLAAISGRRDGVGRARIEISGRSDHVADYFRSEFGAALQDEDLALLTRTSILEVVEPSPADALVEGTDAAPRLARLARANQLIGAVSGPGAAYRYHGLLREFLLSELERREPGMTPVLHRRAVAWYAAAGRTELAIEHAFAGDDPDLAAGLVSRVMLATLYGGRGDTLDRWLGGFEDAVFAAHPPLAIIGAWIHALHGRPSATDRLADIAERSTFIGDPGDGSASFGSARAMLRALLCRRGPEDALANAAFAASAEPPGSPWRTNALALLGSAHLMLGDKAAADAAYAEAIESGAMAGSMVALAKRASLALSRGDATASDAFARSGEAVLERAAYGNLVPALLVNAVSARVAIHLGDLRRARERLVLAQLALPSASTAAPWFSVDALLELARAYLAVSDPAGAQVALREAALIARRRPALGILTTELAEMRTRIDEASIVLIGSSALTPAELRVLPVLSTHLQFEEIGARLHLSPHTIKTQARSIYSKLGASNRSEAIERAVEIGLLEPYPGLALTARPQRR